MKGKLFLHILEPIRAACHASTAHGVPNLARSKGLVKQVFWLLIVVGMLTGLTYNMTRLIMNYLSYPVAVAVSVEHKAQITFPAVTICNMNPIKNSGLASLAKDTTAQRKKRQAIDNSLNSSSGIYNNIWYTITNDEICLDYLPETTIQSTELATSTLEMTTTSRTTLNAATTETSKSQTQSTTILPYSDTSTTKLLTILPSTDTSTTKFSTTIPGSDTITTKLPATTYQTSELDRSSTVKGTTNSFAASFSLVEERSSSADTTRSFSTSKRAEISSKAILTTVKTAITTTIPTKCCCRCCSEVAVSRCNFCSSKTSLDALTCATAPFPTTTTPPWASGAAQFSAPVPLAGSKYPERFALNPEISKQVEFQESISALPEPVQVSMGYSVSDMVLRCIYDGQACIFERDFVSFLNPIHGNCFIFNSGWNKTITPHMSTRGGPRHGLTLQLNLAQATYVTAAGNVAGIRIVITDQHQLSFPEDEGITVSPGLSANIAISQDIIGRISAPYGDCNVDEKKDLQRSAYCQLYPVQYRTAACMNTCYQRNVLAQCDCYDRMFPSNATALDRKPTQLACSAFNLTQDDCMYGVKKQFGQNLLKCDCPDRCNDKVFNIVSSVASWPSESQKKELLEYIKRKYAIESVDANFLNQNLIQINVFYDDFTVRTIQMSPAYLLVQFFADMSGVVGLWFGFAFMTFIEVLQLFADVTYAFVKITCLKKND